MSTWLLRGCDLVATLDGATPGTGTEIAGGDVLVDGDVIAAVAARARAAVPGLPG